jgi:Tol biopolymer transport system component
MRRDGSQRVQLYSGVAAGVSWSPDGAALVLDSHEGVLAVSRGRAVLWRLTGSDGWRFGEPAWSPDGHEIALAGARDGERGIFLVARDGSNLRRLTSTGTSPSWSPDGTRIAFSGSTSGTTLREVPLYVVGRDGSGLRQLAGGHHSATTWSPDGTRLAYSSAGDLFTVAADGSGIRRLSRTIGIHEADPVWEPVGSPGIANAWAKRGARLC